jgi:2-keto-3-deoxy-galactonokinase
VVTEKYQTPFLKVSKGVLQGDCLSPLLFNIVMNTFIQYIKTDQFCQLGLLAGQPFLTPKHWFQFADDAVITTGEELEYETQILLNAFTMWCNWAKMTLMTHLELSKGTHYPSSIFRKFTLTTA